MKRYMFFIGTLGNGGAERVISILSDYMAEQGMDVEILTYYDRPLFYQINPKVKVTAVEKCTGKKNKLLNILWIRRYFRKHARIVLSFLAPFNIISVAAKIGSRVPVVVADRNDPAKVPTSWGIRKLRDFIYIFADEVVVQTEKNKSYFNRIVQKKTVVIYNPVDMKEYTGSALGSLKDSLIISAGRLIEQKNQKMLLEAFANILSEYPKYKLCVFGEGSYRGALETKICELGIEKNVFLPGSTTELYEKMKEAELFVLCSNYEGMPNALIEAMCLGLPVISTKVSGATDLIRNGENGMLVEIGDVQGLTDAMKKMLSDKERRKNMAEEAAKISESLLPEHIFAQWQEVIRRHVSC